MPLIGICGRDGNNSAVMPISKDADEKTSTLYLLSFTFLGPELILLGVKT